MYKEWGERFGLRDIAGVRGQGAKQHCKFDKIIIFGEYMFWFFFLKRRCVYVELILVYSYWKIYDLEVTLPPSLPPLYEGYDTILKTEVAYRTWRLFP